jgi:hypothetical protein
MAHQFVFANATPQRPALYFTILGESAIKMLRYQQQYTFFDASKLNGAIRFINLSQVVLEKDLSEVLNEIVKEVEAANPAIVVVDSFRTALRRRTELTEMEVQFFVQQLALHRRVRTGDGRQTVRIGNLELGQAVGNARCGRHHDAIARLKEDLRGGRDDGRPSDA